MKKSLLAELFPPSSGSVICSRKEFSEMTAQEKIDFAEGHRTEMIQHYGPGGLIETREELGEQRAREYVKAYELMASEQVLSSYLREDQTKAEEHNSFMNAWRKYQSDSRRVRILARAAA